MWVVSFELMLVVQKRDAKNDGAASRAVDEACSPHSHTMLKESDPDAP